jgi:PAS domain-containing protein
MGAAVVPGGEASPVLEPAEHAFDAARLRPPFIRGCTGFDLFEAQRIIAADRNARVVYMNRAAEQLLDKAICLRLGKNRLVPTDRTARDIKRKPLTSSRKTPFRRRSVIRSFLVPIQKGPALSPRPSHCTAFARRAPEA